VPTRIRARMAVKQSPSLLEDRRRFYEEYNVALDRLQADPVAWAALLEEDRLLDGYLPRDGDGE
jgi:hypothetical protein